MFDICKNFGHVLEEAEGEWCFSCVRVYKRKIPATTTPYYPIIRRQNYNKVGHVNHRSVRTSKNILRRMLIKINDKNQIT